MQRALIFGTSGQDGSYMAEYLLDKGYEVHGSMRRKSTDEIHRLSPEIRRIIHWHRCDLEDPVAINNTIEQVKPEEIYNFGAQSHVGWSFKVPDQTLRVNAGAILYMLDAVRRFCPSAKFFQASTSEMYGGLPGTDPQNEETPFHPRSPYGVAKLAAHWLVINYRETYGLKAACGITFNHESVRRGSEFVTKKIADYFLAKSKDYSIPPLELGNLLAQRDWGWAPDYINAIYLICNQDQYHNHHSEYQDYVIGTGKTISVKDFVDGTIEALGMAHLNWAVRPDGFGTALDTRGNIVVQSAEQFFRPLEVNILRADPSKIKRDLGWEAPRDSLRRLVNDMLGLQ